MTREEEVWCAAVCEYPHKPDHQKKFIKGTKWADEHPVNPWISVEEKLPDDDVTVIVAVQWQNGEIHYYSDVFHENHGWEGFNKEEVVAWMSIPELLKGGEK